MSEQIREQVSAFLDGELPNTETELLLKRLTRDEELRESFGRYALIGECLRGGGQTRLSQSFHARVNRAIDGEPLAANPQAVNSASTHWWRPFAGAAIAAGVAAVAVVALQQRAGAPTMREAMPMTAQNVVLAPSAGMSKPKEALSYTVPATVPDAPAALPAARLTNYVFAHSKYSSVLGQNDVLNDLLSEANTEDAAANAAAKDTRDGTP
jgi:sigma-E factor negative regulatory protein RseA